jgi:hypothetical protein
MFPHLFSYIFFILLTLQGGMTLSNMIKIAKTIDFGTLYIKPAFVFVDPDSGHIKLQFEADPNSALGYLYDSMCQMFGIAWNSISPENDSGIYTNCAMHSAGDRAKYGCGPTSAKTGGFCPQMTVAMRPKFRSDDDAAAYLAEANTYVDYLRQTYPSGVAVGSSDFCPDGGCLGLFLNRMDVYQVFKPELSGSWVAYGGHTAAPTASPAPTTTGGCDDEANWELDRCYHLSHPSSSSSSGKPGASRSWASIGPAGQMCAFLVTAMSATLGISLFMARARRKMKKKESYWNFFMRDVLGGGQGGKKNKKQGGGKGKGKKISPLEETMLPDEEKNFETKEQELVTNRGRSAKKSMSSEASSARPGRSRTRRPGESKGGTVGGANTSQSRGRSKTRTVTRSDSKTSNQDNSHKQTLIGDDKPRRNRSRSRTRGEGQAQTQRGRSSSKTRTTRSKPVPNAAPAPPPPVQEHRRQLV